jgi:hypothetical protein
MGQRPRGQGPAEVAGRAFAPRGDLLVHPHCGRLGALAGAGGNVDPPGRRLQLQPLVLFRSPGGTFSVYRSAGWPPHRGPDCGPLRRDSAPSTLIATWTRPRPFPPKIPFTTSRNFHTSNCYKVLFSHAKQCREVKQNTILVPWNNTDPSICLATKVREYLEALGTLGEDKDSCLFKGCMKGARFVKAPMGKNLLRDIGKDVAKELGLQDWTSYTGHCWRRSSATQVAGEGATALDMKRQFEQWQQETTAMRYLDGTNQQMIKMAKLATGQSSSSTLPGPSSSASNEKVVGADLKKVTPSVIATLATKPNIVPVMRKSSMNVSDGLRNRGTESGEQKNNDARVYNFTIGDNCNITIN